MTTAAGGDVTEAGELRDGGGELEREYLCECGERFREKSVFADAVFEN